ncbi:unnamed protein product [Protopolystoma xenopodis]|uniref:Peptide chain release factor domain-containing protein n=1 Tax=Protopolystoma xenopodis TaxID=117903 RepID=A0A3S5AIG7_9PLAT|nr:unnamed protein product [Protopolystoma xenopodis]
MPEMKSLNQVNSLRLELVAGAGGEEAGLFTRDLFNMYLILASSFGWGLRDVKLVSMSGSSSSAEVANLQDISFEENSVQSCVSSSLLQSQLANAGALTSAKVILSGTCLLASEATQLGSKVNISSSEIFDEIGLLPLDPVILFQPFSLYQLFKYEAGVHRVQRIPSTSRQNKIHTSTVAVAVLPVFDEVPI